MLKRLRWQFTLLYLVAALGLVSLIGLGSYSLLRYYFQSSTDQALHLKMAQLFQQYGYPLPDSLEQAAPSWLAGGTLGQVSQNSSEAIREDDDQDDGDAEHDSDDPDDDRKDNPDDRDEPDGDHGQETYAVELAAVFALPVDDQGALLASTLNPISIPPAPIPVNAAAFAEAKARGADLRTVRTANGARIRLLTYLTPGGDGPAALQVGRILDDQDRILQSYLFGLFLLGGGTVAVLGLLGWWLAGRSIAPAQRAWDQQQTFVANASHELRTPLTILRATAEQGLRRAEIQTRSLSEIVQECDYMNGLVDDLLLLSRLDSRRLPLKSESIQLEQILPEVERQGRLLGHEKQIQVRTGETSGRMMADPERVRQLLLILLDNAVRYTPPGGRIWMEARQHGRWVEIRVVDNGPGIPSEHLPHIFERFYQVRQAGGELLSNGLGLAIAKALVEAQGGKIRLESAPGAGTQVILTFPAEN